MSQNKLSTNQTKFLRAIAHNIKPTVMIGANGVTDNLIQELDNTLNHHEIVKIKIAFGEREDRSEIVNYLVEQTNAHLVQTIGKVCVLYRAKTDKPVIELPRK